MHGRSVAFDFRCERAKHFNVVARLVAARHDQRLASDLVERVLDLDEAVGASGARGFVAKSELSAEAISLLIR